jgi:aminocarboxymuconate-semialdehyde decarboxylase
MDRAAQGDVAAQLPSAYATQMVYDSIVHAPKQFALPDRPGRA